MSRLTFVVLGLLALVSLSFAQLTSFTANFQVRRPNTGGAYNVGSIKYSADAYALVLTYTDRNYTEIHKFSPLYGLEEYANLTQWAFQTGQACTGCKAATLNYSFPVYYRDLSVYQPGSLPDHAGCNHFVPIDPSSTNITDAWFKPSDGSICRATWADGADFVFDVVQAATFNASVTFAEPDECICQGPQKQTDIVILIDRSGSIGKREYSNAKATARDFARKFQVSPSGVNVLIAQFDQDVEVILQFFQGVSYGNIDAAINSMQCACGQTTIANVGQGEFREIPDNKDQVCCGKRSSMSNALRRLSDTIFPAARPNSEKLVLFVTDGHHNTMVNGTVCKNAAECGADLLGALLELISHWQGVKIYGIGVGQCDRLKMGTLVGGRYERYTNASEYWKQKNPPIVGAVGCPIETTYCDPTECCGLCQCGECLAPTDCDTTDQCNPAGLYGGRCCTTQPLTCPPSNLCQSSFCDSSVGCVVQNYTCPTIGDPLQQLCWDRVCNPSTGACISFFTPINSSCSPVECSVDADCNDNDACTVDKCVGDLNAASCVWSKKQCDDGNLCTRDFCVDPNVGCQATPIDAAVECNDGVSCTTDICAPSIGCQTLPVSCDDGKDCTEDFCDVTLGRCVNNDVICGPYADNCTISLCELGECVYEQSLCQYNLLGERRLTAGAIAGTVIGVTVGAAGLAVAAFVAFKIIKSSKAETSGGSAGDFAAE